MVLDRLLPPCTRYVDIEYQCQAVAGYLWEELIEWEAVGREDNSFSAFICVVRRRCLLLSSQQWTWQCVTDLWEWFLAKLAQMKPSCFNQRFWLVYQHQELWNLGKWTHHSFRGTRTKYTNISTVITRQVKQAIEARTWRVGKSAGHAVAGRPAQRETLAGQIRPSAIDRFWIGFQQHNGPHYNCDCSMDWVTSCGLGSLCVVEKACISSQDTLQSLGERPRRLSNCEITDVPLLVSRSFIFKGNFEALKKGTRTERRSQL